MLAQGFCDSMVQLAGEPHSLLPGISTTLNWVATAARGRAYGITCDWSSSIETCWSRRL